MAPGKIFAPGGKLVSERLRSMTEDERVRARRGQSNTARVGGSAPGGERRERGQEGRSWPPVHTGPMCSLAAASRASTPLLFFRFLRLPLHPIPPPLIRVIRYPPHRRWLPPVIAFTLNTNLVLGGGDNDNANHETLRGYV